MIVAVDIDLHRIHARTSDGVPLAYMASWEDFYARAGQALVDAEVVLVEVASPVAYGKDSRGARHQMAKWMIYNVAIAERIASLPGVNVLVAPSHIWTRGHPEEWRHQMARCVGRNHDQRECEAMIWFYLNDGAGRWVPWADYLAKL